MSKTIINPFIFPSVILGADFVNATDYDAAVLADGPELFWKLDEASGTTATDSSGNGRNGTYGSAVTVGDAGLFGGADKSPSFVANDDDSVITSSYATNLTAACTLECLITAESGQSSGAGYLLNKSKIDAAVESDYPIVLAHRQSVRGIIGRLSDGVHPPNFTFDTDILSTPDMELNGKFHVVFVYRASGLCEVYINGIQRGSATIGYTIPSNAYNWAFGRVSVPSGASVGITSFKGRAGRVAIYSSALSAARIMAHFNAAIFP